MNRRRMLALAASTYFTEYLQIGTTLHAQIQDRFILCSTSSMDVTASLFESMQSLRFAENVRVCVSI